MTNLRRTHSYPKYLGGAQKHNLRGFCGFAENVVTRFFLVLMSCVFSQALRILPHTIPIFVFTIFNF